MGKKKQLSAPPPLKTSSHGLSLVRTLQGSNKLINEIAWSPDGETIASVLQDHTICLWNTKNNNVTHMLEGHTGAFISLDWSPDGNTLASASSNGVRLWNAQSGKLIRSFETNKGANYSVAWSPDGKILASAPDSKVCLWDILSGELISRFEKTLHSGVIHNIAWSPNGQTLATAHAGRSICIWNAQSNNLISKLNGHKGVVYRTMWSPDGATLASASSDQTIRIWQPKTGTLLAILEGHTSSVMNIRFSPDGRLLASKGSDRSLRLWRCDLWEQVADISELPKGNLGGLAFHPYTPKLATLGKSDQAIRIWELNYDVLLSIKATSDACHYRNAKIVLLGDTGVGKTGLALVLIGRQWEPTESTHGRHVWTFDSLEETLPSGRKEVREILLWDLAGQPGYRIIHQLHLNEIAVALVVFDSRSDTDPFSGVRHWDRALRQAQRLQGDTVIPLKKYLVAARTDRGGIPASQNRIWSIVNDLGFEGFFETSAKEGKQISDLIKTIRENIDWDSLPMVSSNELFQIIKEFLIDQKGTGRLLSTPDDLYLSFCQAYPEHADDRELRSKFETCVSRIENRGLIRRLSFGGYLLLQSELLDAYASALVNAAKSEPDGLGCIVEEDALNGQFLIPSDERIKNKDQEKILLIATVEELLRHEIVLKEITDSEVDLIFPSQFTRERPDAPDIPGKAVVFTFDGPVLNIYATLAVRLSRSQLFKRREMWKSAASYIASVGGSCGIYIRELEEGHGELTLFFDAIATEATRYQFEDYVATHLQRRALPNTIYRRRIFACPTCGVMISDEQSKKRRERGFKEVVCPVCDTAVSLLDREERVASDTVTRASKVIGDMNRKADEGRERDLATIILKGKIEAHDFDVFLCHNSKDKREVRAIGEKLKQQGILPWLDLWELPPGKPWIPELEKHIMTIKSAAVFVGPDGIGPWQNLEQQALIHEFVKRGCSVIPVILPRCIKEPELPLFLRGMTWVDFRKLDPDPFEQLVWGITGERKT
jgi:small GTP-binding protein